MFLWSRYWYWPVLGSLAALVQSAYAQTTPDAGALRQQIERQLPSVVPAETKPKPLTALPPEFTPAAGLSISVKAFRFAGNTLLSDAQIAPAVAGYLNRPIGFNPASKTFEVNAVPDGGLPLQVSISSGATQVLVVISERKA